MASRRWDLLSLIPLVAIVALVALVGALVWIVARSDDDRARTKLATDALWVEQTLRFQLAVDEDMLVRLALDAASGTPPDTLQARARLHIVANPETLSVHWFEPTGALVASVPEGDGGRQASRWWRRCCARRRASARPVYGAVQGRGGAAGPAAARAATAGWSSPPSSLPLMLDRHIPWWIAEQYAVRI